VPNPAAEERKSWVRCRQDEKGYRYFAPDCVSTAEGYTVGFHPDFGYHWDGRQPLLPGGAAMKPRALLGAVHRAPHVEKTYGTTDRKRYYYAIHRGVAMLHGAPLRTKDHWKTGLEVDHINNSQADWSISNLQWLTPTQNKDKESGTYPDGDEEGYGWYGEERG